MTNQTGRKRWAIPEGYIPGTSIDPSDPALISHEAACLLNPSDEDAKIEITIFFEDRDPAGPYKINLAGRRTKHLRFNDLTDPEIIPRDTSYASIIESSVPIIVQHTRLDSRNPAIALLTTIAFALD
ncbi:MAG: sensory rhodopsin transducer [Rhizomicrobium sp.]